MKMTILFLFIACSLTAQNLLPLKIGNRWFYEDEYKDSYEVLVDTAVIFNGSEYYTCSKPSQNGDNLYRLREDGYYVENLQRAKSDTTEWEYYKIDAKIGDIWYYPVDSSITGGFTPSVEVRDTVRTKVFGKEVTIKILYLDGGLIARYKYFTDEFGMLLDSIVPFDDVVARLKGCIIDGVAYGDTTLISGIEDDNADLSTDYVLYQNYPNPFNPATKISYNISQRSKVVLHVYNITGSLVKTLVNEEQHPGKHQVTFDGTGLASGVYLYRLTINNNPVTKKMQLVK